MVTRFVARSGAFMVALAFIACGSSAGPSSADAGLGRGGSGGMMAPGAPKGGEPVDGSADRGSAAAGGSAGNEPFSRGGAGAGGSGAAAAAGGAAAGGATASGGSGGAATGGRGGAVGGGGAAGNALPMAAGTCPQEEATPAAAVQPPAGVRWVPGTKWQDENTSSEDDKVSGVALGGAAFVGVHRFEDGLAPVRWSANGNRERLHPGTGFVIRSADDAANVILLSNDQGTQTVLWQKQGAAPALEPPATTAELALVSGNGRVLVYADRIWAKATGAVAFGGDLGASARPLAVNRDGRIIVGGAATSAASDARAAWIWKCGSAPKVLPCPEGYEQCDATSVSDDGNVIFGLAKAIFESKAEIIAVVRWIGGAAPDVISGDVRETRDPRGHAPKVSGDGKLALVATSDHTFATVTAAGKQAFEEYVGDLGIDIATARSYWLDLGISFFLSRDGTVAAGQGPGIWAVTVRR